MQSPTEKSISVEPIIAKLKFLFKWKYFLFERGKKMMNELKLVENGLIKVYTTDTGEYVVDGRELWQGLESNTKFADWIKRRLEECDAIESEDYFSLLKNEKREVGATQTKEYIIKLDTAKEMAMLERNDVGKQYRRYFIEVEKKYRSNVTQYIEPARTPDSQARLLEAQAKQAEIMLAIADRVTIDSYKQIVYSKAMQTMTGEYCLPLPKAERKTYSATEIGEVLGISANKVGKISNEHHLKTPEYGQWFYDKARHSDKQVETWRYYDNVIDVMRQYV